MTAKQYVPNLATVTLRKKKKKATMFRPLYPCFNEIQQDHTKEKKCFSI